MLKTWKAKNFVPIAQSKINKNIYYTYIYIYYFYIIYYIFFFYICLIVKKFWVFNIILFIHKTLHLK